MSAFVKWFTAVAGAAVFVFIAFGPGLLSGQNSEIKIDEKGGIKVIEPKNAKEEKDGEKTSKEKMEKMKEEGLEFRTVELVGDKVFVGSKHGLFELRDGALEPVAGYEGESPKGVLAIGDDVLLVASKDGLYRRSGGKWTIVSEMEGEALAGNSTGPIYLAAKKMGLYRSTDAGLSWEKVEIAVPTNPEPKAN